MHQTHPRVAASLVPVAALLFAACSSTAALAPSVMPLVVQSDDEPPKGDYGEAPKSVHFEVSATPRNNGEDNLYGFGVYGSAGSGWGGGLQVHSTLEQTSPEAEPFFGSFSGELAPRTNEFVFDVVATRRLNPSFSVFAGAGISTRERYRRFLDDAGNDFFVRVNRNVRGNFTAGAHLWIADTVTLSAQYDSAFEAATFALGWQF